MEIIVKVEETYDFDVEYIATLALNYGCSAREAFYDYISGYEDYDYYLLVNANETDEVIAEVEKKMEELLANGYTNEEEEDEEDDEEEDEEGDED